MERENQSSELVLAEQISREEFGRIILELVKDDREVRKAIIELVLASPNIERSF